MGNSSVYLIQEMKSICIKSQVLRHSLAGILGTISILGTICHILILYVFARCCSGDQRKKYLLGIAIAALMISLTYYPLIIAELLAPQIFFNEKICALTKLIKITALVNYFLGTLVVSIWNYIFFMYPLKGRIWIKTSRVATVWISTNALAILIGFIGKIITKDEIERIMETDQFRCWDMDSKTNKIFVKCVFFGIVIPCLIASSYLNCSIYRLAGRIASTRQPFHISEGKNHTGFQVCHMSKTAKKQSILIICIFLMTWLPFVCVLMAKTICGRCVSDLWRLVAGDSSFLIASLAPFTMFMMTPKYRRSFLHIISCGKFRKPNYHGGSTRYEKTSTTIN